MSLDGERHRGYAPSLSDICENDYTDLSVCLECGQLQGTFPKETPVELATPDVRCDTCGHEAPYEHAADGMMCSERGCSGTFQAIP